MVMEKLKRIIKITKDGSVTIFLPEIDEHYHSIHGAIQESLHVFIKEGIDKFKNQRSINIFEVGFGTGLNALLAADWSEQNRIIVNYTSIEPFPVEGNLLHSFIKSFKNNDLEGTLKDIHQADWDKNVVVSDYFNLKKIKSKLLDLNLNSEGYDIVFYDAFGPRVQPDLWTIECFEKIYQLLNFNGALVTYCAKGQVKRDLKSVGFRVETCQGPPGKREMIRAWK